MRVLRRAAIVTFACAVVFFVGAVIVAANAPREATAPGYVVIASFAFAGLAGAACGIICDE
jgi:hypothetical protein